MDFVHVKCGFCFKEFQIDKGDLARYPQGKGIGIHFGWDLDHSNGGKIRVDISIVSPDRDICPICAARLVAISSKILTSEAEKLMGTPITTTKRSF